MDMSLKPVAGRLPLLRTGGSRQTPERVAEHGDGWMTYPRDIPSRSRVISAYAWMQSLCADLLDDPDAAPRPIRLGFASGIKKLRRYLNNLETIGVNHVTLNLRGPEPAVQSRRHACDPAASRR